MMRERFRAVMEGFCLPAGCTVTAALSGGADSVVLLHLLKTMPDRTFDLRALHVHHGLRGEAADRDQAFCEALCRSWGIPLTVRRGDAAALAAEKGLSTEEAARILRYGFLAPFADGERQFAATAHQREDQAETFFINLYRGSGSEGLRGMQARRGGYLRPLLGFSRAEIEAYAAAEGLSFVEDETNRDTAYQRNFIRHKVLPLLREREEADFAKGLASSMQALAEESEALDLWAARVTDDSVQTLAALPAAVLKRVLDARYGAPLHRVHFGQIRACLRENPPAAQIQLPRGRFFRLEYGKAVFTAPEEACIIPVEPGVPVPLKDGKKFLLRPREINSSFTHSDLDCDKITDKLVLRRKAPGDRFRPQGRSGTVRLQKRLKNDRVPRTRRDALWVLAEESGRVLWVEGYGADVSAACDSDTRRAWSAGFLGDSE